MNKFEQNLNRMLQCHETKINDTSLQIMARLKKIEKEGQQKKQQLDLQRMAIMRSSKYL